MWLILHIQEAREPHDSRRILDLGVTPARSDHATLVRGPSLLILDRIFESPVEVCAVPAHDLRSGHRQGGLGYDSPCLVYRHVVEVHEQAAEDCYVLCLPTFAVAWVGPEENILPVKIAAF